MARLPLVFEAQVSPGMKLVYRRAVQPEFGLTVTYQALFTSSEIASQLANLDAQLRDQAGLEPWVRFTVALTVAHERDNQVLWDSFEPLARQAGVRDTVIDAIAAGTAPRGLLPKEGIWVHFATEVLRNQVRDSTWQAITHLVGDSGVINLALTVCYYEMMARLNDAFGLETG
jgi:4-carboxymuconolactone decarboxylase